MAEITAEQPAPDGGADNAEVSVVIVSWNSGEDLLDCLDSLHSQRSSSRCEAIVVDNGSSDGSTELVRRRFPAVRLIVNRSNRGLAAANNQGITASRAPFVLISNPDVLYPPGAIDALLGLMDRRPQAAFAVPKIVHPDGRLQTAAGDLPSLREALLGYRLSRRRPSAGESGVWWHGWSHDQERPIGHGAEASYLVRRSALTEIGLQDERFILDWEGLDWSRRAWRAGWEVWFCPSAVVTHIGGVSIRKATSRWILSTHLGMYRYFRSGARWPARPLLAALIGLRALVKLAAATLGVRVYELAHWGGDAQPEP